MPHRLHKLIYAVPGLPGRRPAGERYGTVILAVFGGIAIALVFFVLILTDSWLFRLCVLAFVAMTVRRLMTDEPENELSEPSNIEPKERPMPVYVIPPDARRFEIAQSKDGEYMVVSETTGQAGVAIPVHSEQQAQEICDRLNRGEHEGTIEVPLKMP